ncbi:Helicase associated domain protein [Streptomyces parvus]|uniref:helicase associated domain-containing protein n=2 Tax=Streptomyces parvus TaxID=66428 RepID=UPI003D718C20
MAGRLAAPLRRHLLAEEQGSVELLPGFTVNGVDVGIWTTGQTDPTVWDTLSPEQQKRLESLGLHRTDTAPAATTAAGKGEAFERGIAALTQYATREGRVAVPRAHVEETPHGPVRLGNWISNTRSSRNKLTVEQREQLAAEYGNANMDLALRGLELKTLDPYLAGWRMRVVPALGHLAVRMITNGAVDRTVQNWIADDLSRSTVKNTIAVLVRVMEQAVRDGIIKVNPARVTGWQKLYKQAEDELLDPRALALPD